MNKLTKININDKEKNNKNMTKRTIVVFVNIDNKDQYIYLFKKNFFTNFSKVVYYDPV